MIYTLGLDMGSTYTKALILDETMTQRGRFMVQTGSRLLDSADEAIAKACSDAAIDRKELAYTITTGYGRHMVPFRDLQVTDLTATARGSHLLFPGTRTILDIGGQTMKASRIDDASKVMTFRLNDKCAAGTGAFLEKTARYMGYSTQDIGSLLQLSKANVPISGVCAVFAESEVISHLSEGVPPEDIMFGAILSLTDRSVQLLKRIKAEPEFTLVGGILRWESMVRAIREKLKGTINVPDGDMPQFVASLGCAILGHVRLEQLKSPKSPVLEAIA